MTEQREYKPSPEQQEFLGWISGGRGSAVLEAVAGAGKTTTLVEGVKLMSGSVFLGAYNKKMADELKVRIAGMAGKKAGTFHSAGYSALRRAAGDSTLEIDEKKVSLIVDSMLAGQGYERDVYSATCRLVSLAKQTGFLVRDLVPSAPLRYWMELVSRYDIMDGISEDVEAELICAFADRALRLSNENTSVIDYDDMVYMPLLRNLRMFRNDWVLVDEAQDTNAVRRELAARMLKPGGRLVAVGDPHQAIYGFTGADSDSLRMIRERFGAITLRLSVSWRCPQAVVAAAREYVGHINPAPTAAIGEVTSMTYREMLESVSPGDAVICRFNAPLVELCLRLIREGKAARIEGRDIGQNIAALVGRWKVKTLDALEVRLEKWRDREEKKIRDSERPDEAKLARLGDKHTTVVVLLERARERGMTTVAELRGMIEDMFADVGASPSLIVLSSVHRSKGLEWRKVHILGRGSILPSPRVSQEWQKEQEINLAYVAVTRAQQTLVDVAMPTPQDLAPQKKTDEPKKEAA